MPSKILSFLLKLVFAVSAVIVGIGLLALALVMVAFSVLWALLTGRKLAPAVVFSRFQGFPTANRWSTMPTGRPPANSAPKDVVDVEVREVPDARNDKHLP